MAMRKGDYVSKMTAISIDGLNADRLERSLIKAVDFAISDGGRSESSIRIRCVCECGERVCLSHRAFFLTLSCGCLKKKYGLPESTAKSPYPMALRRAYHAMMFRCYNDKSIGWDNYGGRGVAVCDGWKGNMIAFCEWGLKNGWKEGLQLDKDIKSNGGLVYSPYTCCFVTRKENLQAKPTNKRYLFRGKKMCISEISDITGVDLKLIWSRLINLGWPIEMAATADPVVPGNILFKPDMK